MVKAHLNGKLRPDPIYFEKYEIFGIIEKEFSQFE